MDSRLFLVLLSLGVVATAVELHHVVKRQVPASALLPYVAQNCASNPNGNNSEAFHISHPEYCNAFFTCEPPTAHAQCTFCGEGLYYPEGSGNCVALNNAEPQSVCNGKVYVGHGDKVNTQVNNGCSALIRN